MGPRNAFAREHETGCVGQWDGVLDHLLDHQPHTDQSTILVVLVEADVWDVVQTDRRVENAFVPHIRVVPVEEKTKDAIGIELAMYAVHLHYALPLSVSFVVPSADGFSSQVCSHLHRLGRESSVVPDWSLHASVSDETSLRDFLQCIHRCCADEEHVSKDELCAMFKYRGQRLMKNAVSLGWLEDAEFVSLTKRGLAAIKYRHADTRNNANFVVGALLNTPVVSLKELNSHLWDCSSPHVSPAHLSLLREDALALGVLARVGKNSYCLSSL